MKANKAKTSKKAVKKLSKRVIKKELEASISDKFLEALKSLGHDAGKFSKDIKKTSKLLAKKLADKYKEVKNAVEVKLDSSTPVSRSKKVKKSLTTPKKLVTAAVHKAEKVVAKVNRAAVKAKAPLKKAPGSVTSRTGSAKSTAPAKSAATKPAARKPASASKSVAVRSKAPVVRKSPAAKPVASVMAAAKTDLSSNPSASSGEESKTNL